MPHHAKASGWTTEPSRRWFTHCDQCSKWQVVADYYEVYPPLGSEGEEAGWWWACTRCLLDNISTMLEDTLAQMDDRTNKPQKIWKCKCGLEKNHGSS